MSEQVLGYLVDSSVIDLLNAFLEHLLGDVSNFHFLALRDEIVVEHVLMRAKTHALMNWSAWTNGHYSMAFVIRASHDRFEILVLSVNQVKHDG